jgi:hypothetical protein
MIDVLRATEYWGHLKSVRVLEKAQGSNLEPHGPSDPVTGPAPACYEADKMSLVVVLRSFGPSERSDTRPGIHMCILVGTYGAVEPPTE